MELTIETLLKKLKGYELRSYLNSDNEAIINDVKLLSTCSDTGKADILYIAKVSEIHSIVPLEGIENILCIADCTITLEEIQKSKFNLIVIDENIDLMVVYNKLQDIINYCKKISKYSAKFLNALIEDKGIQQIIDIGYQLFGNPMFVTDNINRVLAYTENVEVDDPNWHKIVKNGYISFNVATSVSGKRIFESIHTNRSPIISAAEDKVTVLRTGIRIGKKVIGQLTIPGYFNTFSENDIESAALLSNILSLEMQKNNLIQSSNPSMVESFITDLLDGRIKDRNIFKEEMKFLGWQLKDNIFVLVIRAKQDHTENISQIKIIESIKKLFRSTIAVIYNTDIVLIISSNSKTLEFDSELKGLMQLLVETQLHVGVSRCFQSLLDIKDYYNQAVKAIELGYCKDKKKILYLYESYVIYHLLEVCERQENLKKFCHPSLLMLEKYDQKNGTDFMKSLYCYLINDKNLVKTGSDLHMHRNTMSYRIKKIEEIMNLDIEETSFYLLLSFEILEFMKNKRKNN